jgi:hypothetical protein
MLDRFERILTFGGFEELRVDLNDLMRSSSSCKLNPGSGLSIQRKTLG